MNYNNNSSVPSTEGFRQPKDEQVWARLTDSPDLFDDVCVEQSPRVTDQRSHELVAQADAADSSSDNEPGTLLWGTCPWDLDDILHLNSVRLVAQVGRRRDIGVSARQVEPIVSPGDGQAPDLVSYDDEVQALFESIDMHQFDLDRLVRVLRGLAQQDYAPAVVLDALLNKNRVEESEVVLFRLLSHLKEVERCRITINYIAAQNRHPGDEKAALLDFLKVHYAPDSHRAAIVRLQRVAGDIWNGISDELCYAESGCTIADISAIRDMLFEGACQRVRELPTVRDMISDLVDDVRRLREAANLDLRRASFPAGSALFYGRMVGLFGAVVYRMSLVPKDKFVPLLVSEAVSAILWTQPEVSFSEVYQAVSSWIGVVRKDVGLDNFKTGLSQIMSSLRRADLAAEMDVTQLYTALSNVSLPTGESKLGNTILYRICAGLTVLTTFWSVPGDVSTKIARVKNVLEARAGFVNSVDSMSGVIFEACNAVLEVAPQAWATGDVSLFFSQVGRTKAIEQANVLASYAPHISIGGWLDKPGHTEGVSSITEYYSKVRACVSDLAAEMVKKKNESNSVLITMHRALLLIQQQIQRKMRSVSTRVEPYGVMLVGKPGQGKTTIIDQLASQFAAIGLETEAHASVSPPPEWDPSRHRVRPEWIGRVNSHDKYDSTLDSDAVVVIFDEVGNSVDNPPFASDAGRIVRLVNRAPCDAVRAEVEAKGQIFLAPKAVIGTSNMYGTYALGSNYPMSVLRRLEHYEVLVKPELASHVCDAATGSIRPDMLAQALAAKHVVTSELSGMPDIYHIYALQPAKDGMSVGRALDAAPMTFDEFLAFVSTRCRAHLAPQEALMAHALSESGHTRAQYVPIEEAAAVAEISVGDGFSRIDDWLLNSMFFDSVVTRFGVRVLIPACFAYRLSMLAANSTFLPWLRFVLVALPVLLVAPFVLSLSYSLVACGAALALLSVTYITLAVRLTALRAQIARDRTLLSQWMARAHALALVGFGGAVMVGLVSYLRDVFAPIIQPEGEADVAVDKLPDDLPPLLDQVPDGSLSVTAKPTKGPFFPAENLAPLDAIKKNSPFYQYFAAAHAPSACKNAVVKDLVPTVRYASGRALIVGDAGSGLQVLRISGNALLTNSHLMRDGIRALDSRLVMFKLWDRSKSVRTIQMTVHLSGPYQNAIIVPDSDVMIIVDERIHLGHDVARFFVESPADLRLTDISRRTGWLVRVDSSDAELVPVRLQTQRSRPFFMPGTSREPINPGDLAISYRLESGLPTTAGWCGAPLLTELGGSAHILGIHCAGASSYSVATVVSASQIKAAMRELMVVAQAFQRKIPQFPYNVRQNGMEIDALNPIIPHSAVSNMHAESSVVGVTAVRASNNPSDTTVAPSLFRPFALESHVLPYVTHAPPPHCRANKAEIPAMTEARLKTLGWGYTPRDGPFKQWVGLTHKDMPQFDEAALEYAIQDYYDTVLPALREDPLEWFYPLTDDEVVNGRKAIDADGCKIDLMIPPMDMTTSTGAPLNVPKKSKATHVSFEVVPGATTTLANATGWVFDDDYWKEVLAEEALAATSDDHPGFMFQSALKQEPVLVEKDSTRVFQVAPMPMTVGLRRRLAAIAAGLCRHWRRSGIMVGLDATGSPWDDLVRYMSERADGHCCADFKKFDLIMRAQMSGAAFRVIIRLLITLLPNTPVDELCRFAAMVVYPVVDVDSHVILVEGCNPSGQALTSVLNSVVNALYHRAIMYMIYTERHPGSPVPSFASVSREAYYGDDVWLAPMDGTGAWFNFHSLRDAFKLMGITYTLPNKGGGDEEPALIGIEQVEFLKRSPVLMTVPGIPAPVYVSYLSPMSLNKTLCCMNRTSDKVSDYDRTVSAAISLLQNRLHWPEEFEALRGVVVATLEDEVAKAAEAGITRVVPPVFTRPFEHWRRRWVARFNGVPFDPDAAFDVFDGVMFDLDGELFAQMDTVAGSERVVDHGGDVATRDVVIDGGFEAVPRPVVSVPNVTSLLSRPFRVGEVSISASGSFAGFDPFAIWANAFASLLRFYTRASAEFEITMLFKIPISAGGLLVVGYIPLPTGQVDAMAPSATAAAQMLRYRIMLPSVATHTFDVPFINPSEMIPLASNAGSVTVGVSSQAIADTGNTFTVMVYGRAKNIRLSGYKSDTDALVAQSGVVDVANQAATGDSPDSQAPMFGHETAHIPESVPATIESVARVPAMYTVTTISRTTPIGSVAAIPVSPFLPMSVGTAGTVNITLIADPNSAAATAPRMRSHALSPAGMVALPYRYWRGRCRMRLYFVTSGFTRGVVHVGYVSADDIGSYNTDVECHLGAAFNVQDQQYVDLDIPWCSPKYALPSLYRPALMAFGNVGEASAANRPNCVYMPVVSLNSSNVTLDITSVTNVGGYSEYCNGFVVVSVLSQATFLNAVASAVIRVMADVWWEDLELFHPTRMSPISAIYTPTMRDDAAVDMPPVEDEEVLEAQMDSVVRSPDHMLVQSEPYSRARGMCARSAPQDLLELGKYPLPVPVFPLTNVESGVLLPAYTLFGRPLVAPIVPKAGTALPTQVAAIHYSWVNFFSTSFACLSGGLDVSGVMVLPETVAVNELVSSVYVGSTLLTSLFNPSTTAGKVKLSVGVSSLDALGQITFVQDRAFHADVPWVSPFQFTRPYYIAGATGALSYADTVRVPFVALPYTAVTATSVYVRPGPDYTMSHFLFAPTVLVMSMT